jgi:hypothetical protein
MPNAWTLKRWPSGLLALALLLFFWGARVVADDGTRLVVFSAAAAAWLGAVAAHVVARIKDGTATARAYGLLLSTADASALVGAGLVLLGTGDRLSSASAPIALIAGLVSLSLSAGTLGALELVAGEMRATGFIEMRRVRAAWRTAAVLVFAAAGLAALTYGVDRLDVRRDLSFAAPTSPSAATISLFESTSCGEAGKPEVFLFFERGSSAYAEVADYFEALRGLGARLTVQDQAADPELAKALKVSKNGTVGFRCGKRTENWSVGEERDDAERKLKKLDEEVRTRLAKVGKEVQNVYVTVGHGERSLEEAPKGADRPSARGLKRWLESTNAKLKKFGLGEGAAKAVPDDAALVIVAGPTEPFLVEEARVLAEYVRRGGSLLVLLDPELPGADKVAAARITPAASLEPLLAALGVSVDTHEVLNDAEHVQRTNTSADHAFLFSTSFGNHKAVKTLSGARGKAALLFLEAAAVTKRPDEKAPAGQPKVSMLARTRPKSFADKDGDRAFDEGQETRAILDLAAAIELPVEEGAAPVEPKDGKGAAKGKEGRAIVVGDADVVADMLVSQPANAAFAYEALSWLLRDAASDAGPDAGTVQIEEDVEIRHTRDEDVLWFYGSVVVAPVAVLVVGLVVVALRRRRRTAAPRDSAPAGPSGPSGGAP